MYQDYFHLKEMPFSIAPNPRFLYMSGRHREALAHLLYGLQGEGGIILLTGEVGAGKTTLCRCLLEQIEERYDIAFVLNPKVSVDELLATICDEFHIQIPESAPSVKMLVDAINAHLLRANAQGRRAVLIIDEAQNLSADVLEQLRLLTNLETDTRKLLQIILIGQPELQDMVRRPELKQVAQRIVARYHLGPITRLETAHYVAHRLRIAGTQTPIFPYSLIRPLYRLTGGVPRLINLVCDRALLGTYVKRQMQVTPEILNKAAREVIDMGGMRRPWNRKLVWSLPVLAICAGGVFAATLLPLWSINWLKTERGGSAPVQTSSKETAKPAPQELRWPDAILPRDRSEGRAFQDLFNLYGITYDPDGNIAACTIAETVNMRCQQANGNLSDLLRANQPAVLLLNRAGEDLPFHAVLTALDEQSATVIVAGVTHRVALAQLTPLWSGKYVLLWYAPPGVSSELAVGNRSPAVDWLRQSLARIQGGNGNGTPVFDAELVSRVKAFQIAEGITPDGIAGSITITRLNVRLGQSLPRLSKPELGASNVLHP